MAMQEQNTVKLVRQISKGLKNSVFGVLFLILISCETSVKLTDHINVEKPLIFSTTADNKEALNLNSTMTIEPYSEKYNELLKWSENNLTSWEPTPASYLTLISVSQDDFHLMYFRDGYVVANFVDKEGKANQYKKKISPGELDFLLK